MAFVQSQVPVEQVPHPRIVALAPGVAQIVRDLGMGRLLVGRHANDAWSDPALPSCGDQEGIDYERLIATEPTHIFIQWGKNPIPERLTALAAEKGWSVHNVPLLKLADIRNAVDFVYDSTSPMELGALLWERAHTYATPESRKPGTPPGPLERQLTNARSSLFKRFEAAMTIDERLAGAGRILLLYQGEGERGGGSGGGHPAALGPGSYHHDMLLALGGKTATEQGKEFMPLDAEDVSRIKPDGIIIVRPRRITPAADPVAGGKGVEDLAAALGVLVELDIPAVKNKRIALIDDPMALVPGTNLATVAEHMRAILKEWAQAPMRAGPAGKPSGR